MNRDHGVHPTTQQRADMSHLPVPLPTTATSTPAHASTVKTGRACRILPHGMIVPRRRKRGCGWCRPRRRCYLVRLRPQLSLTLGAGLPGLFIVASSTRVSSSVRPRFPGWRRRATSGRGRSAGWRLRRWSACWPTPSRLRTCPGGLSAIRPIPGGWRRVSSAARSRRASWPRRSSGSSGCRVQARPEPGPPGRFRVWINAHTDQLITAGRSCTRPSSGAIRSGRPYLYAALSDGEVPSQVR